jgi:hypothetical protein
MSHTGLAGPAIDVLDKRHQSGPSMSVTESVKKPWIVGVLIALAVVVVALWLLTFNDFL